MNSWQKLNRFKLIFFVLLISIFSAPRCSSQTKINTEKKTIIINHHETAVSIAAKLKDRGIINDTKAFLFWTRIFGYDKKIKSGRYQFASRTNIFNIIKALNRGGEDKVLATIPEGYRIKEIAKLLAAEGICAEKEFIKACGDITMLRTLNIDNPIVEGFLFPDSYDFPIPSDPKEIVKRMVKRFWQVYQDIQKSKLTQSVILRSIDSIVTIASLIEKEAKLENERPIIASVFYNRMKYNMPLQSCATVEYVLPNHKEQLSIEDTKINSPYNTYIHRGLPPTPICNPGRASLVAAMNPAQTKYLYFAVENNRSHYFSKSFTEHQNFLKSKNK